MMKQMKLLVLGAMATVAMPTHAQTVLFDNLSNLTDNTGLISSTGWQAQKFVTGGSTYSLASISLLMSRDGNSSLPVLEIYTDNSGVPGTSVHALTTTDPSGASLALNTFSSTGFALAANSSYWAVLRSGDASSTFNWAFTLDPVNVGIGGSTAWGDSSDLGVTWTVSLTDPYQMQVLAAVPEPSAWATGATFGSGALASWVLRRRRQARKA